MAREGKKITVKHYLNKRAKTRYFKKEEFYPLYIQIIVAGKKAQIKSKLNDFLSIYKSDINRITDNNSELSELLLSGFFSDSLLEALKKEDNFPVAYLLRDEVEVIKQIIILQEPFTNKDFGLSSFSFEYQKYSTEINQIFDNKIKQKYREELKNIFLDAIDQEEKRDLFRITNFLIHYINWNNSFSSFYDTIYEIIPNEFRQVENLLSKELRTTIKAYMAFHSKVSILSRFFEKRSIGKISTLSFLDWETHIRKFVHVEFDKIFGEQKTLEYIVALDNVLEEAINETPENKDIFTSESINP